MPVHDLDYTIHGDDMQFVERGEERHVLLPASLMSEHGVSIGIAFQRRLGVGLFGGEGLFFATLTGPDRVWL